MSAHMLMLHESFAAASMNDISGSCGFVARGAWPHVKVLPCISLLSSSPPVRPCFIQVHKTRTTIMVHPEQSQKSEAQWLDSLFLHDIPSGVHWWVSEAYVMQNFSQCLLAAVKLNISLSKISERWLEEIIEWNAHTMKYNWHEQTSTNLNLSFRISKVMWRSANTCICISDPILTSSGKGTWLHQLTISVELIDNKPQGTPSEIIHIPFWFQSLVCFLRRFKIIPFPSNHQVFGHSLLKFNALATRSPSP